MSYAPNTSSDRPSRDPEAGRAQPTREDAPGGVSSTGPIPQHPRLGRLVGVPRRRGGAGGSCLRERTKEASQLLLRVRSLRQDPPAPPRLFAADCAPNAGLGPPVCRSRQPLGVTHVAGLFCYLSSRSLTGLAALQFWLADFSSRRPSVFSILRRVCPALNGLAVDSCRIFRGSGRRWLGRRRQCGDRRSVRFF